MTKSVEFLFDFGSPNAYLAYARLPDMAARAGADVVWTPMLLGGVFKATGNQSPAQVPAKGAYMRTEIGRFVARHGIPFAQNPHFPVNTLTIMRGAVAYQTEGDFDVYVRTMFEGMWVHGRGLDQPHEIAAVLDAAGLDAAAFADRVADPAVKGRLRANTEDAVARGVFGAPTFFVGDDMFFGQDRLDWVEAALGVGG